MSRVLNLDDENVSQVEMTVEDAREILDGRDAAEFEYNLDIAQGRIMAGESIVSWLVIKIVKE